MSTLYESVLTHLQASKGRWSEVAAGSGVSKRTIEKIARGEIADPGVSHIEKLAAYFQRPPAARRRASASAIR